MVFTMNYKKISVMFFSIINYDGRNGPICQYIHMMRDCLFNNYCNIRTNIPVCTNKVHMITYAPAILGTFSYT